MNFRMKKFATAAVLSFAVFGATLSTTAPVQATHKIGHAIAGGIIGGIIGGAIANGANRRRAAPPVYVQPAPPVYVQPAPPVYVQPAPPPRSYGNLPSRHYDWCFNKYRSYHASSNTYQPYGGYPRAACRSPWW